MLRVNDLYCDRCSALHVSGSFAHHQELILNCIVAAYYKCLTVSAVEPVECVGGNLVTYTGFGGRGRDLIYNVWGYSAIVDELLCVGWWLLLCCVVLFS
jgi:hypothetical protein